MANANKIVLVCSEKSLEKSMMTMMIATTAAASGMEVSIFTTFWGLNLVRKNFKPKLAGIMAPFTFMMEYKMRANKVPSFKELRDQAVELGVRFIACSTTLKLFGWKREDLLDDMEIVGAASFLKEARDSGVQLFIG